MGSSRMVFSWLSSGGGEAVPETERGGYECAPYTIIETQSEYQVRNYPARKWATVVHEKYEGHTNSDMPLSQEWKKQPQNKSFMKLFNYITGAIETGAKISMTVPVSTKVTSEKLDEKVIMKEEMGFYVPSEHQESAPPPRDDYGDINFDLYYRQGFDAPYKFWGRKNEVFFIK